MNNTASIPIMSFFTGGGFLDIGFEQAGFQVVWTNEANNIFAEMYKFGMSKWKRSSNPHANEVKISEIRNIENISNSRILKCAFPNGKPKTFGVIGGPPCPDFSIGAAFRLAALAQCELSESFYW